MRKLWNLWIAWTKKKAEEKSYWDMTMYGTGMIQRKWWGYKHIPILTTFFSSNTSNDDFYGKGISELMEDIK